MPTICTKPLSAGEVVFKCKPLVHCVVNEFKGKVCDNCLKSNEELKRCVKCHEWYYCSKDCQLNDWFYHKNECKLINRKLFEIRDFEISLKLLMRLYLRILTDDTFVTKRYELFNDSGVCLNEVEVNIEKLSNNRSCIKTYNKFIAILQSLGHQFECRLLFHWCCLLFQESIPTYDITRHYIISRAYYIQSSFISHSCTPNSALVFDEYSLELRVMKPIGLGEEITFCRINDFAFNKTDRQMKLKDRYIDCKCDKCELNLDSDMDYQWFNTFREQLFRSKSIDEMESFECLTQFMGIGNTIYGQNYPNKTEYLLKILNLYLNSANPRHDFIKPLINKINDYIAVSHGQNHSYYKIFMNASHVYRHKYNID